jgi:uncharacterized protein (DUF433 family)
MSTTSTIRTVKVVPSHITIDDKGIARIDGTRMKVQHLIGAWKSGADSPEKLQTSYPELSLAQIHDALAYYYDHKAEIDAKIEQDYLEVERLRAQSPAGATRAELERRLRERGQ